MMKHCMKEKLRSALASRHKLKISDPDLIQAAVLIPIFRKDGEYNIVFTKRSDRVLHHKGQISFPGGARSPDDATLAETALRESWEELGLKSRDVEIVGELDDTPTTTSGFNISPFVAFIPYPYKFALSPFEISEVFDVPISALLNKAKAKEDRHRFKGQIYIGHSYEYEGRIIWGATAKIVEQFLQVWQSICPDSTGFSLQA
jgi:8-oxo-dGTP pyrophosphatase MutT (NUDIX family)